MNLLFSVSRMHLALKAYQELLLTVNEMDRSKDENIQHGSNVIKSTFFFVFFSHFGFFVQIMFFLLSFCYSSVTYLLLVGAGNIFYLMEFREIFLTLLRKYDERMQPRSFLRDLVESTHLFLKMLERFCKGRNNLVVQVRTETALIQALDKLNFL